LIIVTAGIALCVLAGIIIIFNQPQQGNPEQRYAINTVGLKDNYKINEPIEFTVNVQGYGLPCGTINAKIFNYSNQHNKTITSWGEILDCISDAKPQNFSIDMPVSVTSTTRSISLNREGTYYVVSSFDQFHGMKKTTEKQILVSNSTYTHLAKKTHYYGESKLQPKVTLYDYSYDGIDQQNALVLINNQTYYQTTLDYSAYDIPKGTSVNFQNITFSFPYGSLNSPGGGMLIPDIKFQDGSEEIYGQVVTNPDRSGYGSGIGVPTQYGPHVATNSVTVLGNHTMPQAGITIYHDRIKLLVNK